MTGCVEDNFSMAQGWGDDFAMIQVHYICYVCERATSIQLCPTLCNLMDCSPPGSSVHGILRQGSWSGLSCPPPGDFPDPGMEPRSSALQADSLPSEPIYDYRKQRLNINTMQYQLIL